MDKTKKNICIGIGIIIAALLLFLGIMCIEINGDRIAKNTYINNVNIGGLSKSEAINMLDKDFRLEKIEFTYNSQSWNIEPSAVDFSYNTKETVENAYKINRSSTFIENLTKTIKSNFFKKNNLNIIIEYNKDKLSKEIEGIAKNIDIEVKDALISISGSEINVSDEVEGLKVNIDETLKNFDKEIKKDITTINLAVAKVDAKVTKNQLKEVDTVLGSYSTKISGSVTGKHTNIKLATKKTSNVLLMPGDTFSYNEHTGLRSVANGFTNAPVIVQGVLQEGLGGGVCQVSSTLYNATLYAGLEYMQLKNHSIPSGYVDMGRDATVSDTGLDFVFKNNLQYPIYIKNYVSGNTVVCQVYGSSKDKQNISISTNIDGVTEAPVKKVNDPTIPNGEEKVLEKGRNAYTVSTYRIYKDKNGSVTRKEKVYTSYYPKKQEIVAVGTKEEEKLPIPEVEKPEDTQSPSQTPPQEKPQEPTI
ncbi:MAG: VanW family protein [Romboutsia sp.]